MRADHYKRETKYSPLFEEEIFLDFRRRDLWGLNSLSSHIHTHTTNALYLLHPHSLALPLLYITFVLDKICSAPLAPYILPFPM